MDWGTVLWNKLNDVDILFNQKNDFIERIIVFLKDNAKSYQSHNKHLKKTSKLVVTGTKKKQEEVACTSSLMDFAEHIDSAFEEYSSGTTAILNELNETIAELSKVYNDSLNEKKRISSVLSKSGKELAACKSKVNAERKALIAKKAEVYALIDGLKNLSKNDEKKTKDMKSSLNEKKKAFHKMKSAYEKTTSKYVTLGFSYYNDILPKSLNELESLDSSRTSKLKDLIGRFMAAYTLHTPRFVSIFSNLQAAFNKTVDIGLDSREFMEAYDSKKERPDGVVTYDVTLYDDPNADPDPKGNAASSAVMKDSTNSLADGGALRGLERVNLDDYPYEERERIALMKASEVKEDIKRVEKEINALMVLGSSSSKFGGEVGQVSACITDNQDKLNTLKSNYSYYQNYGNSAVKSENNISWNVQNQGWDAPPAPVSVVSNKSDLFSSYAKNDLNTFSSPHDDYASNAGYQDIDYNQDQMQDIENRGHTDEMLDYETVRVAVEFVAEDEGEFSADAGEILLVLERDDGSGWTLVARARDPDNSGFIPTSFLE